MNNKYNDPKYIDLEPFKEEIINLYNSGWSAKKIGIKFNVNRNKIYVCLRKWGINTSGKTGNRAGFKGYKEIPGKFLGNVKNRARRDGIDCSISVKEIWELYTEQDKKCIFCGEELKFDSYCGLRDGNVSLDRKDCSIGYHKDNCQLITKDHNSAKHMKNNEQYINQCERLIEWQRKKK